MQVSFVVHGISCTACVRRIEEAVRHVTGAYDVYVNPTTSHLYVHTDLHPTEHTLFAQTIIDAVSHAGFKATLLDTHSTTAPLAATQPVHPDFVTLKRRVRTSLCLLVPLMYLSMGHMVHLPIPGFLHPLKYALSFALVQAFLTLPVLYANRSLFRAGLIALYGAILRRNTATMDSLISLGSLSSFTYGLFATARIAMGVHANDTALVSHYVADLYFESAAMIVTLVTVGKYLSALSKGRTSRALTQLLDIKPKTARVIRQVSVPRGASPSSPTTASAASAHETHEIEIEIPAQDVLVGDTVLVKAGELVPVDGIITSGQATLDESNVTGESIPVEKGRGDSVISASLVSTGFLKFRAERVGEHTTLAQIISLVEKTAASKVPVTKLVDAVSAYFVPSIVALSLLSGCAWLCAGASAEFAFSIAVTVLVISCPCVLGLAVPTALMVATGKGAQMGILIKSAQVFQQMARTKVIAFDKTGTLTLGRPTLSHIHTLHPTYNEEDILHLAYSLEVCSGHPLAAAISVAAQRKGMTPLAITDFNSEQGLGLRARLVHTSYAKTVMVGNARMMVAHSIDGMDTYLSPSHNLEETPLFVAADKNLVGVLFVSDPVKVHSSAAIGALHKRGIQTLMLTGDVKHVAHTIAARCGVKKSKAELLPHDKEREISALKASGMMVAMVGDGVNDAPALASADVGIAIGAGSDIAVESADVVLMRNCIRDVVTLVDLSIATVRNMKQNLFWAFFYNTLGVPLAAGLGYPFFGLRLTPMLAAAAMSLSSVSVLCNALRLNQFQSSSP
ncbi:heavy metal translocating P-type ATPase [Treponema pallidum]|uniref:Cation-transporting ATPase, P-type n=3 Tax=Treponema pallidum TaxID=160 RepID=O83999_TREPA|nr:heavy metal translocating P-type ATPase [Treponema pallidum]AAC26590.1 cation-transporting ATPase, P-type [Treponema pallidum subsp. pallidum str. Nichols]ACD71452.1 cation-transporting ATPase, P-type [Treponema pallidum subsp. pallidum SS14]ADD73131.1 copper-translocating P-type ATPase [Treponema pallidum subsp. pallidum str. Chicago]AEZ61375.1 P-ATPase superfamily P-type ATPase transporter [Treponema pallidum subsp. pallidum DAL-1]AFU67010.1 P-ATPase superfamily P-type ATPase transporter 